MIIDKDVSYTTEIGQEVEIHRSENTIGSCIFGAIKTEGGRWRAIVWDRNGRGIREEDCLKAPSETPGLFDRELDIPWDALRESIQCVAMDSNGDWYSYESVPPIGKSCWDFEGYGHESLHIINMPKVVLKHWKNTLTMRPPTTGGS